VDKSATREEALKNAISAAELYIKATSQASNDQDKARLREKCKQLLSRAEEIKQSPSWTPKIIKELLKAPMSERAISRQEEIILLESSKLHGFIFPRWTSEPQDSVFEEIPEGSSFYV
jgi:hypothetical protein